MSNANNTVRTIPAIGDRFVSIYGVGCGERVGTITKDQTNEWGPKFAVEFDDSDEYNRKATISRYVGTATLEDGFAVTLTGVGIGTYLIVD